MGAAVVGLAQQQPPAFRSRITMVPVDVRVVDRNGKPITDLKPSDFSVTEDGVVQSIRHFSTQALIAEKVTDTARAQPRFRTAATPEIAPQNRRVFLILLGRGRMQGPSKELPGLSAFVKTRLLPQDQVAVLAYNRATDFTTEHEKLVEVVERITARQAKIESMLEQHFSGLQAVYGSKAIPPHIQKEIDALFAGATALRPREIRPGQITDEDRINLDIRRTGQELLRAEELRRRAEAAAAAGVANAGLPDPAATATAETLDVTFDQYVAQQIEQMQDLGNIYAGIDYLRHIDGEKHLVVVTPRGLSLPSLDNDRNIGLAASDARVAIDIFFTGGVAGVPSPITLGPTRPFLSQTRGLPNLPTTAAIFSQTFNIQTLRYVGELTGGRVTGFRASEDFFRGLDDSTRFQYLLGYYPTNTGLDGKLRQIAVKVNRPGATVLYRRSYYATQQLLPLDRRSFITHSRITAAGSYTGEITDISVAVKPPVVQAAAGGTEILIDVNISSPRIAFTEVDGRQVGALDVGIYCGDERKQIVCETLQRVDLKLGDESYQKFLKGGVGYTMRLPVTGKPAYVKVIVYDYVTDLLGSAVVKVK